MRPAVRGHWPTLWELFQLAAAATFTPLRVWADNMVETRFPRGLLIWAGFMCLLGLAVWLVWVRASGQRRSVTVSVFWLLLAAGSVGSLFRDEPVRVVLFLGGIVVFVACVYRLADMRSFQLISTWATFFVLILPVATALGARLAFEDSDLHDPMPVIGGAFESHPDIVVLVTDAHGAFSVLVDLYGFQADPALERLDESGLTLVPGMRANYSLTFLSLPSFFQMGYPVEDGDVVTDGDLVQLQESVGGRNQLVSLFKAEGYQFVMVEAGWSGSRCTAEVDVCIGSPWPDEATSFAIDRSVFSVWSGLFKGSLTAGTLNTLSWLEESLPAYLSNGRPDFVFLHLLIPHPPLRLGADCVFGWKPELGGRTVGVSGLDSLRLARRKAAYIDQVECAQNTIAEVASTMGDNVIFLTFGDHGPDSGAQLFKDPQDWSQADVDERLRIFFAAKASFCSFDDLTSLVNVGRRLLNCLTASQLLQLKDRFYLATGATGPAGESLPIHEVQVSGE